MPIKNATEAQKTQIVSDVPTKSRVITGVATTVILGLGIALGVYLAYTGHVSSDPLYFFGGIGVGGASLLFEGIALTSIICIGRHRVVVVEKKDSPKPIRRRTMDPTLRMKKLLEEGKLDEAKQNMEVLKKVVASDDRSHKFLETHGLADESLIDLIVEGADLQVLGMKVHNQAPEMMGKYLEKLSKEEGGTFAGDFKHSLEFLKATPFKSENIAELTFTKNRFKPNEGTFVERILELRQKEGEEWNLLKLAFRLDPRYAQLSNKEKLD